MESSNTPQEFTRRLPAVSVSSVNSTINSIDEENVYKPEVAQRPLPWYRRAFFRPTWKFWTALAITMLILAAIVTSAVLVVAHRHHPTTGNANSPSNTNKAGTTTLGSVVDLGYSKYQGIPGSQINSFVGMRFAAPPVDDLRFAAPQDPLTTSGIQSATQHGAFCLPSPSTGLTAGASEDCLFVDVMAPTNITTSHPVFVYIQGGGLNSNASPNLNGSHIIENGDHDIVFVTFNYRVGPYGFLASKEVQAGGALNAGNLDQRFLLQWVQKYISNFGGDPKRVTLGGASAGAASVDLHLMAYGGRDDGLFHQAAGESNSFGAQLTVAESQYQYDALVSRVNCSSAADTLACLRAVPIATLAAQNSAQATPGGAGGSPVFMYSNVIDGNFTQDYSYANLASGKYIKVPTIFGSTTNEGTVFTPSALNSASDMNNFLQNNWVKLNTSSLAQIDTFYPEAQQFSGKGTFWRSAANAYGEMRYNCPGIYLGKQYSTSAFPSYQYHWDVLTAGNNASGLGVTHTAEGASIFGTAAGVEGLQNTVIGSYWSSFIRTGDPNAQKVASAPTWNPITAGQDVQRLHFVNAVADNAMEVLDSGLAERCDYLAGIGKSLEM